MPQKSSDRTFRIFAHRIPAPPEAPLWTADVFGTARRVLCRAAPQMQERPAPSRWRDATHEDIREVRDPQQKRLPWRRIQNAQTAGCWSTLVRECLMLGVLPEPLRLTNRGLNHMRRKHHIFQILDFHQNVNRFDGDGTAWIPQNTEQCGNA